ncbi:MAG TPA: COQ9 family protein [Phenylobacterium sp.]|uniref:COQ9 family protein n=1 Tax=Phenylobacterium sp. TaxID=1871053 RepID=UPI002B49484E|nr:COQ9 family protein [Phenylobacterium sp.]HKR86824.1 COQ9 family protein [Phenylobacterium sp.]
MTETADWIRNAEQQVLDQAIRLAPLEGWTARMAGLAGRAAGFSDGETELLLPRGPADLAALLSRRHDARALLMLQPVDPENLKIRERISKAVEARIDAVGDDESAARRWCGWLALPQNLALGGQLAWESADVLWRWAGDVAADENHYSKRALLAGILTGAVAIRLGAGRGQALRFAARRIDDVMRFERWKAKAGVDPQALMHKAAAALGRMRYGRGEPGETTTPGL